VLTYTPTHNTHTRTSW